jgi:site-specific recombinase XerD
MLSGEACCFDSRQSSRPKTDNTKSISPLRQRMIEDMTLRKLSPQTQTAYIRAVKNFTRFLRQPPDTANAEDLRRYQLNLVEQGISSGNLNATVLGLKLCFETTLQRPEAMAKMSTVREPRTLPVVLVYGITDKCLVKCTRTAKHYFLRSCSGEKPTYWLDTIGEIERKRLKSTP